MSHRRLCSFIASFVILSFVATSVWAAPPEVDPVIHIVQRGETIYSIARRYGTSVEEITSVNGLANPNWIYAGQKLTIPTQGSPSTTVYTVRWGDTLFSIAQGYGTTANTLAWLNGLSNPNFIWAGQRLRLNSSSPPPSPAYPGTPAPALERLPQGVPGRGGSPGGQATWAREPSSGSRVHLVQPGEILIRIARRYNTSVWALARANNLANPSLIYVGQRLMIPEESGQEPSPGSGGGGKWIDVNLTTQRLVAYEGDQAVYSTVVSTGTAEHPTITGRYRIQRKYRYDDMSYPGQYYLPDVPYVMYFYSGYALHGTYWHNNFGTPMSFGCVNLTVSDAQWLFDWTTPTLPPGYNVIYSSASNPGTLVVIHY
ncbi:MAG: LysM peptidoglycan-binding domain-containing protein [Anaerolineae bacterium]